MAKSKKSNKHDGTNKNKKGLTPMQELFVRHFLIGYNATQAAKDAGYSEHTAMEQGSQLLKVPSVRKAISDKLDERYDTLDITGDRILREMAKIAFSNLKNVATWNGDSFELKDSSEISEDDASMLKSLSKTVNEYSSDKGDGSSKSLSFVVHDKLKALEMLAKNKKLLTEKLEIHDKTNMAAKLAAARKRREAGK